MSMVCAELHFSLRLKKITLFAGGFTLHGLCHYGTIDKGTVATSLPGNYHLPNSTNEYARRAKFNLVKTTNATKFELSKTSAQA